MWAEDLHFQSIPRELIISSVPWIALHYVMLDLLIDELHWNTHVHFGHQAFSILMVMLFLQKGSGYFVKSGCIDRSPGLPPAECKYPHLSTFHEIRS